MLMTLRKNWIEAVILCVISIQAVDIASRTGKFWLPLVFVFWCVISYWTWLRLMPQTEWQSSGRLLALFTTSISTTWVRKDSDWVSGFVLLLTFVLMALVWPRLKKVRSTPGTQLLLLIGVGTAFVLSIVLAVSIK